MNTMSSGKQVVEINNLHKGFGNQEVLKNISFHLTEGENLAVLGKSGSGKTVLIKCIVGLLNSDRGTIDVLGQKVNSLDYKQLKELRKKIGFLFQGGALYDSMTVKQNLEFPLERIRKELDKKTRDEKINEALESVGLADAIHKMPSELSGGMRKRISLARTIVADPLIMLYDEPTAGLDPVTADEISTLITEVQKKYKTSSLIITHDIACARITANRLIMLKDAAIYREGQLEEFEKSGDPAIQAFFKHQ